MKSKPNVTPIEDKTTVNNEFITKLVQIIPIIATNQSIYDPMDMTRSVDIDESHKNGTHHGTAHRVHHKKHKKHQRTDNQNIE